MHRFVALFAVLLLAPSLCPAEVTLLDDDFDGSELDPAWCVRLDRNPPASSWEYDVASSRLTVTDVGSLMPDVWGAADIRRTCVAPGDFRLECVFSWDTASEPPSNKAMQNLRVSLVDTAGGLVALVQYYDCWASSRGVRYAAVGSSSFQDSDRLPYIGEATVRVERTAGLVEVWWDDESILASTETSVVDSVELSFWYADWPDCFFGTESVDRVTVTAPETPVENVSWSRIKALSR